MLDEEHMTVKENLDIKGIVDPLGSGRTAMGTDGGAIIRSRDFSVYYWRKAAVREVSLEISTGQVTAIIGPSGCGKSTYLRAINRMNDLIPGCRTSGLLELGGQDLHSPRIDVVALRKMVGMVFQKPNPFPKSVFDNVAFGPRIHGTRGRNELSTIVRRSLERAALWDEVKDRLYDSALGLSRVHDRDRNAQHATGCACL
jgi:phosphate transport system ATP-binding protein